MTGQEFLALVKLLPENAIEFKAGEFEIKLLHKIAAPVIDKEFKNLMERKSPNASLIDSLDLMPPANTLPE